MREDDISAGMTGLFLGRAQGRNQGFNEGDAIGYRDGQVDGHAAGHREGYQIGRRDGKHEGFNDGWNKAVTEGNAQIHHANGVIANQQQVIATHAQDKASLVAALEQQAAMIAALEAKVAALEEQNAALRGQDDAHYRAAVALRETVAELQKANERLTGEVAALDGQLEESSRAHIDLIWEHNRSMVFLRSVRGVLEKLATGNTPQAAAARIMFAENYHREVEESLAKGFITAPPDADAEFRKTMPRTHGLIVQMLEGALDDLHAGAPEYSDCDLLTPT